MGKGGGRLVSYEQDRKWADDWLPLLRALIGPYLLGQSSFEEDTQCAADLVVLTAKDMKIACRVRRPGYAKRFPDQFTIRSRRASGSSTELEKIVADEWGDWLFYGHDDEHGRIDPWWLINLTVFRHHWWTNAGVMHRPQTNNGDGTYFTAYPLSLFPAALIIGDSVRHCRWVQGIQRRRHAS